MAKGYFFNTVIILIRVIHRYFVTDRTNSDFRIIPKYVNNLFIFSHRREQQQKLYYNVFSFFSLAMCRDGCVGGVCVFNKSESVEMICKCFPGYSGDDCSVGKHLVWY
jgi:hypothetical protein